jgi:hypothetical protein
MQTLRKNRGISMFHLLKAISLRPRDLADDGHPRSFTGGGLVEQSALQRKAPSLWLLTIAAQLSPCC